MRSGILFEATCLDGRTKQSLTHIYTCGLYRPPSAITEKERRNLVPPDFEVDMESYVCTHDKDVKLCREQTAKYKATDRQL
jgi:hypothetical protein